MKPKTASTTRFQREARNLRKNLQTLVVASTLAIKQIDAEMKLPASVERGKRIAAILNALELQKDLAERFGLAVIK